MPVARFGLKTTVKAFQKNLILIILINCESLTVKEKTEKFAGYDNAWFLKIILRDQKCKNSAFINVITSYLG